MHTGDQVRRCNVDESAGGKRHDKRSKSFDPIHEEISQYSSKHTSALRNKTVEYRLRFIESSRNQHAENPQLLRDLVRDYQRGRHDAEMSADHECAGNDKAVKDVMHRIAYDHQVAVRMYLAFLALVPVKVFFKDKKRKKTDKSN